MKNNFWILFSLLLFFCSVTAFADNDTLSVLKLTEAQQLCLDVVSKVEVPKVDYLPPAPPSYWSNGILTQIGLSQVSLTNWAEGGSPTMSLNAYIDANANYAKGKMIWENRLTASYGFIQTFDKDKSVAQQFKKSDDKIQLSSKWGYSVYDRLYFSLLFTFRTQLTQSYDNTVSDPVLLSNFMSPGYISVGTGIDYKPLKFLSLYISPLTGNFVVVSVPGLREKYGNKYDQAVRSELGAQIKMDIKFVIKSFKFGTQLVLFSDYLHNPQNIQVHWDVDASFAVRKFLVIALRTNLIYDDNIIITDSKGNKGPRVQFKELLSLNFSYTFGKYQKAK